MLIKFKSSVIFSSKAEAYKKSPMLMQISILILLHFLLILSLPAYSRAEVTEDSITAAFLCNVFDYVEWTGKPLSKYVVCIAADNDLKSAVSNHIISRKLQNKISVKSLDTSRDTSGCNAVFVDQASHSRGISYVLRNAREQQVLTIGNGPSFLDQGGLIRIKFENKRLVLGLNLKASGEYKIKINPRLTSLARHVQ